MEDDVDINENKILGFVEDLKVLCHEDQQNYDYCSFCACCHSHSLSTSLPKSNLEAASSMLTLCYCIRKTVAEELIRIGDNGAHIDQFINQHLMDRAISLKSGLRTLVSKDMFCQPSEIGANSGNEVIRLNPSLFAVLIEMGDAVNLYTKFYTGCYKGPPGVKKCIYRPELHWISVLINVPGTQDLNATISKVKAFFASHIYPYVDADKKKRLQKEFTSLSSKHAKATVRTMERTFRALRPIKLLGEFNYLNIPSLTNKKTIDFLNLTGR
jgi:hypothetical protein